MVDMIFLLRTTDMFRVLVLLLLLASPGYARPWNIEAVRSVDKESSAFSRSIAKAMPTLVPILSLAALAYVGYAGLSLALPGTFDLVPLHTVEVTPLVESGAANFLWELFGVTDAGLVVRNVTASAAQQGASVLKRTTRSLDTRLSVFRDKLSVIRKILSPECLPTFLCQIGQFTGLHFPTLAVILRSIDPRKLDDYAHALIDGTTIGDCTSVFHECPLNS